MPDPHSQSLNAAAISAPAVRGLSAGSHAAIELTGAWDIRALESCARQLQALLVPLRGASARWDLSGIQRIDHIGALLIWRAWGKQRPAEAIIRAEHEPFFRAFAAPAPAEPASARQMLADFLCALGAWVPIARDHTVRFLALFGQLVIDAAGVLRRPHLGPWREISASVYRVGAQALGITAAVGFLIGIVLSYLSSEQLKAFGANAFIVNILGIGIIRELGPVLCAVLVAGRSGSAITAQLGVMRVTQELDALSVMGIPHTTRLVLPRVIALAIALPLLVLWTSAIALAGGAIAAQVQLDMPIMQFIADLPVAVPAANLALGIGKGAVFGVLIALVACHFGLRIEPNTESLGVGTTNSVVSSITAVIVADALIAVAFNGVGFS